VLEECSGGSLITGDNTPKTSIIQAQSALVQEETVHNGAASIILGPSDSPTSIPEMIQRNSNSSAMTPALFEKQVRDTDSSRSAGQSSKENAPQVHRIPSKSHEWGLMRRLSSGMGFGKNASQSSKATKDSAPSIHSDAMSSSKVSTIKSTHPAVENDTIAVRPNIEKAVETKALIQNGATISEKAKLTSSPESSISTSQQLSDKGKSPDSNNNGLSDSNTGASQKKSRWESLRLSSKNNADAEPIESPTKKPAVKESKSFRRVSSHASNSWKRMFMKTET
jgi:hypothetical protein